MQSYYRITDNSCFVDNKLVGLDLALQYSIIYLFYMTGLRDNNNNNGIIIVQQTKRLNLMHSLNEIFSASLTTKAESFECSLCVTLDEYKAGYW